ncbi:hypothetical protein DFQ01_10786 [Paenibacillus cellulosilyticus]|uniref:Serine aminopeptidase S33 domain-containing protein n=1 Tax=Paenibacillus cellulosilyticus TaxID=375489 RepID=A0A2V2YWL8_9BACL|nr:hypothetical protein DFQ01_10786 [Paenibacillus cellulosilyticus]
MYEILLQLQDQGKLASVLHLPDNNTNCPIVIYCPGKNGERFEVHRLAVNLARRLNKIGVGFLRFDYFGLGLSDGVFYQMTTSSKVSNVLTAQRFVHEWMQVNNERLLYLGFSDGARIAVMAANRSNISRLLLWSPLLYEIGGNFPGNKKPRFIRHPMDKDAYVMPWAGLWVGMDFYRDLNNISIEQELDRYRGNSMVIYGDDDPLIIEEFEVMKTNETRLFRPSERNHLEIIEGGGHLFTSQQLEEQLLSKSIHWIQSQMMT